MNTQKIVKRAVAFVMVLLGSVQSASAADRYWDGGTVDIVEDGNGASAGGTGTWNTLLLNWDAGTSPHVAWNNANNDIAIFGGATGIVTLGADVTVGGISFTAAVDNYDITSTGTATITLVSNATLYASSARSSFQASPEIMRPLAGSGGFTKTGAGSLCVTGPTTGLSGTITINAGTLWYANDALGSCDIVIAGNSSFNREYNNSASAKTVTNNITLNAGVTATMSLSTFYYSTDHMGILAGDSSSKLTLSIGSGAGISFQNTANTFEGEVSISGSADFGSLADSEKKISVNNGVFRLRNGGVSMNFVDRQFEMLTNIATLENDSTSSSVTVGFVKPLIATIGNNAKTFTLSGVNTGNNTFAGAISNSATGSGVVSVTKAETGKWILSGTNTYTGVTTVNAGTLVLAGEQSILDTGTLNLAGGKVEVVTHEKVKVLQYSGVAQLDGTYGSTSSTATYKDDTRFVGTGILYVNVDPPPPPPSGTLIQIR